jgi:hypothetical protein
MLYYRIIVLNFQFVQYFHEQNLFYKSVRNMTQKVVHKMGVVNDGMYYFCTKKFFLSNCHIMKKKMLISIKN